jgi:hypothetical protein
MKEDIQLRFEQAAKKMESAIEMANKIKGKIPMSLTEYFQSSINELSAFRRTTLAYVYHLRETNLTAMMRNSLEAEEPFNQENLRELKELLLKDSANMINSAPINTAINLLNENVEKFLKTYFLHTGPTYQKAGWNITSD